MRKGHSNAAAKLPAPRQVYTRLMLSRFRLLLIWLVVLAVPAHGVAAATMQFCGPGHYEQLANTQAASAEPGHHHQRGHEMSAHHHAQSTGDDAQTKTPAELAQLSKLKCSACAACCMAIAMPPAVPTVAAIEAGAEHTLLASRPYVGPAVAGLERPPRLTLD